MTIVFGEITQEILRVYERDDAKATDPYDFALTVVGDEGTGIIKALSMPPGQKLSVRDWIAIKRHMKGRGYRRLVWRRRDKETGRVKREIVAELA
jgi:hypothetical protein